MYYHLDWQRVFPPDVPLANTETNQDLNVPWTVGVKCKKPIPDPIVCHLKSGRGTIMRDMFLIDVPLFSDRMLEVFYEFSINNLDIYPATIHGLSGEVYPNYKAVNILGTVLCADIEKSICFGSEPPFIEFSQLVINEKKIPGLDIFRLAENTLIIIISERVKQKLEQLDLVGVTLQPIISA